MKKFIILLTLAGIFTIFNKNNEYIEIPSSSIRMRVIANSNTEKDQNIKYLIKENIEEDIYELTRESKNIEEAREVIQGNKESLSIKVDSLLKQYADYSFSLNYGKNYFPEKEYKGVVYPAGNYESLVIKLGKAEGNNWWCAIFPPICNIDENQSDYDYQFLIKSLINKYN